MTTISNSLGLLGSFSGSLVDSLVEFWYLLEDVLKLLVLHNTGKRYALQTSFFETTDWIWIKSLCFFVHI